MVNVAVENEISDSNLIKGVEVLEKDGIINIIVKTVIEPENVYDDVSIDKNGKHHYVTFEFLNELSLTIKIYSKDYYYSCLHQKCNEKIISLIPTKLLDFHKHQAKVLL